jgi:arylsulfatase A-like enzyme
MFTGVLPAAHGCDRHDSAIPGAAPTFPEVLKKHGYFCAGVVSNPFLHGKFGFARGFDEYDDESVFLDAELGLFKADSAHESGTVGEVVTADSVNQQAVCLLGKARDSGQPFFLFVVYFDPHDSYVPPPFDRKFDADYSGSVDGRQLVAMRHAPPPKRDLEHLVARYDGEIAYIDRMVARLLDQVDLVSDPEHTLVILVSDHGEAFAEHGSLLHGNSPHGEEVMVPMICTGRA